MADEPIPSIEGDSSPARVSESAQLPSQVDPRTPRVTVTPAPSSSAQRTPSTSDSDDEGEYTGRNSRSRPTEALIRGMEQVHLSDPGQIDMTTVAAAFDSIARESSPGTSLRASEFADGIRENISQRHHLRVRRSSSRIASVPHNVEDEEPPTDAFNEPSFQDALSRTKTLMAEVAEQLESGSLHIDPDTVMHRLRNEARELAEFRGPTVRTVAFVGGSGTGKSSLLNSLLDVRGLARTSSSGTACTCVATEYHFHQSDDITVEVELFGIDEYTQQLQHMLSSYRHFMLHESGMDTNEDSEGRDRLQAEATLALQTFRSMFRGRLEDEAFLLTNPERSVLESLKEWTEDLLQSEETAPRRGLTLDSCSDLLARLSSDQPLSNEPAIWPCIRKIKVFLHTHILRTGLILVDLPGLRDLNLARRNVTERFLRQCDEIFVTCTIDRATSDQGVRDVFDLAGPANLSRVGIICTRSDVVVPSEALRDYQGERNREIQSRIEARDIECRELEYIRDSLNQLVGDALSIEDQDELLDLSRQQLQATRRKADAVFELTKYLVEIRNKDVTEDLVQEYGPSAPTGEVAVFCISNWFYSEHRDEAKDDALPYLRLSGIMDVRQHCIAIVSTSQHLAATNYMRHSIPALLAQIQLWLQSGAANATLELRQELLSTMDTVENCLRRDLTSRHSAARTAGTDLKQRFDDFLYDPRTTARWSQAALNAAREWEEWSHQTYSAFCRNYGIHRTGAVGWHNWNEEALEGMAHDVNGPWQVVNRIPIDQQRAIKRLIEDLLDRVVSLLDRLPDPLENVVAPLITALENRLRLVITSVEQTYQNLEAGLSSLHVDALSGIRTSFLGRAMEASYRQCNLDSVAENGPGVTRRRREVIRRRLGQERLFPDLMRAWRQGFRENADRMQEGVRNGIDSELNEIRSMLDILRDENAATESEQDAAFRDRVSTILTSAQHTHDSILEVLSQ